MGSEQRSREGWREECDLGYGRMLVHGPGGRTDVRFMCLVISPNTSFCRFGELVIYASPSPEQLYHTDGSAACQRDIQRPLLASVFICGRVRTHKDRTSMWLRSGMAVHPRLFAQERVPILSAQSCWQWPFATHAGASKPASLVIQGADTRRYSV